MKRSGGSAPLQLCAGLLALALATAADGQSAPPPHQVQVSPQGQVVVDGIEFESWNAYVGSDFFRLNGMRCGTADFRNKAERLAAGPAAKFTAGPPADCDLNFTNPAEEYDPSVVKYYIPVVVHVLMHNNGNGFLSEAMIQSQIDVLNEDFLALPGTNGAPGADIQIEFFLTTLDPDGNPTNGITYTTSSLWFADGGTYYASLGWDPNRFLNIYTNTASGYLGYVPGLPQGIVIGSLADRVVVNYEAFGRNSPLIQYDLGRTATHEVGHFLGLYHVFAGCDAGACYTAGDRICDTNSQSTPNFGCNDGATCGVPDSNHNYLDYVDDICMDNFSLEQGRRMRCTLENWRVDLGLLASFCPDPPAVDCNSNCIADDVEIAQGTNPDCNNNGIPDSCDLGTPSLDCNSNGIPDECEDCDGNGIADECEVAGFFTEDSPTYSPIGLGSPVTHTFVAPPLALNDVTLHFAASADIGSRFQALDIYLNDVPLSIIYNDFVAIACDDPPTEDFFTISAALFNTTVAGGDAVVRVETFDGVNPLFCLGTSTIAITLSYDYQTGVEDVNANGVPDACDLARGDSNLDGLVNTTDLLALLGVWGACLDPAPGNCPEDTNGDGLISVIDLLNLLAGWD